MRCDASLLAAIQKLVRRTDRQLLYSSHSPPSPAQAAGKPQSAFSEHHLQNDRPISIFSLTSKRESKFNMTEFTKFSTDETAPKLQTRSSSSSTASPTIDCDSAFCGRARPAVWLCTKFSDLKFVSPLQFLGSYGCCQSRLENTEIMQQLRCYLSIPVRIIYKISVSVCK